MEILGHTDTIGTIILFCLSVIGLTNIIVDPATIFEPVRKWVHGADLDEDPQNNRFFRWLDKLMSCYQCAGFWVGMFCGVILISWNPFIFIFICGMAGSFVATWGAYYLNYIEAKSVINE